MWAVVVVVEVWGAAEQALCALNECVNTTYVKATRDSYILAPVPRAALNRDAWVVRW